MDGLIAHHGVQRLQINLPWPPSINHYWRHTKNGHYISNEGRAYRDLVLSHCFRYKNMFPRKTRLSIDIEAYPPDKRRRDLDNVLKSLLDALQHAGVYEDDCQIDIISISRKMPLNGIVNIMIKGIPQIASLSN